MQNLIEIVFTVHFVTRDVCLLSARDSCSRQSIGMGHPSNTTIDNEHSSASLSFIT